MNRPFTGAMQFDGEIGPGLYLDYDWICRYISAAEEVDDASLEALVNRALIERPQRAELKD